MAIYHLEAKVISRSTGRSAVAASAYLSCSKILNDYDGVQHDYTRKKGLVWQQVFLPECAPQEWRDRSVLWNAVEENEKTKDSRLAREFVVALPIELSEAQWEKLLFNFISDIFVADGMCADVAIHDPDPPGHNPHAHIMLTVRPLDEKGNWQYKTEKEYLCVRNGEEKGFTAAEFKAAQANGWEKQYQYKVGKKKVYMAPSAAEAQGYERASKYPKSTKYGRQNPISERWNSEEQLVLWRKAWADVVNLYLDKAGRAERIDHRSHAERGLEEQPTIHEGVVARALEKKGIVSDRCELNRQIKADNALLRELKVQMKKLAQAVKTTLPALAEAMETLRANMIVFRYQVRHISRGKYKLGQYLDAAKPTLAEYLAVVEKIKNAVKERKALLAEKKEISFWNIPKAKELNAKIAELTENIEELKSEKAVLLNHLDCADDGGIATTVNNAFAEFMRDIVNLDPDVVSEARTSRDNLFDNIAEFDNKDGFFDLCDSFNVHFGSFARKTKCRDLDDVDLMIGIAANGATYYSDDPWDEVRITASATNAAQKECTCEDGTLNSTQVSNKFKKKLESVREYSRSEIRRNGEAIILNLKSKEWSFDIVPCFHTVEESDGRSYYLIPNGNGNWKKTAPDKDKGHVTSTNQSKDGRVLELIRLCKKWNKVKNAKTLPSYMLETMIINFADSQAVLNEYIDLRFRDALSYIAGHILNPVYDMKGIQGDINNLGIDDKLRLQQKAWTDYNKACEAWQQEQAGNHKEAIKKWGEILGSDFPTYG